MDEPKGLGQYVTRTMTAKVLPGHTGVMHMYMMRATSFGGDSWYYLRVDVENCLRARYGDDAAAEKMKEVWRLVDLDLTEWVNEWSALKMFGYARTSQLDAVRCVRKITTGGYRWYNKADLINQHNKGDAAL